MFDDIIAPLFTTAWGRRLGLGILIGLSIILIYLVFSTLITWYQDIVLTKKPAAKKEVFATDETHALIARIPDEHLFGGAVSQQSRLPVTSLQLRLVGVIQAVPEKFSRVIISEGDKPGKVYQVGDSLSSGVRVYAITRDGVVLENGGRLEKLPLQRPSLEFQGMPKPMLPTESKPEE